MMLSLQVHHCPPTTIKTPYNDSIASAPQYLSFSQFLRNINQILWIFIILCSIDPIFGLTSPPSSAPIHPLQIINGRWFDDLHVILHEKPDAYTYDELLDQGWVIFNGQDLSGMSSMTAAIQYQIDEDDIASAADTLLQNSNFNLTTTQGSIDFIGPFARRMLVNHPKYDWIYIARNFMCDTTATPVVSFSFWFCKEGGGAFTVDLEIEHPTRSTTYPIPIPTATPVPTATPYAVACYNMDKRYESVGNVVALPTAVPSDKFQVRLIAELGDNRNLIQYFDIEIFCLVPTSPPTEVTIAPTNAPSNAPTVVPSAAPTIAPSNAPSNTPTNAPSNAPSIAPSVAPSKAPSNAPSIAPSNAPSNTPSNAPSNAPSIAPSVAPTVVPSAEPTIAPSNAPSNTPSNAPSNAPSIAPSVAPSKAPSNAPSIAPSNAPSTAPSIAPSNAPSNPPSKAPSDAPSIAPSVAPTESPTACPDYNRSMNSNDGIDITHQLELNVDMNMETDININSETVMYYESTSLDMEYYDEFIYCNASNVSSGSDMCFVACLGMASCALSSVIPINDNNYLPQLLLICNETYSCDMAKINISDIEVDKSTVMCAEKKSCRHMKIFVAETSLFTIQCKDILSCESMDVFIIASTNGSITIHCLDTISCKLMSIKIITDSDGDVGHGYKVSIWCNKDHSCDGLSIDSAQTVNVFMYMYKYSDNINIIHSKPEKVNIQCGDDRDNRYIRYNTKELLDEDQIHFLAEKEYSSGRMPCQNIHILCTANTDFPQECTYEYQLKPLDIEKIIASRQYATCLWFELDRIFEVLCKGNCGDNTTYFYFNISIPLEIVFNFDDSISDKYHANDSYVFCDEFFGSINSTQSTSGDIDFIFFGSLLSLYTANSKEITDISSPPRSVLNVFDNYSATFIECEHEKENIVSFTTSFTVKTTVNNENKIAKIFEENSLFYNGSVGLLVEYFDDTIAIYPTRNKSTVFNNTIINTYTLLETIIKNDIVYISNNSIDNETYYIYILPVICLLILFIICGMIHKTLASKECSKGSAFYRDPFHPIDDIKNGNIISYGLQLVDVFTDVTFIYDILKTKVNLANITLSSLSTIFILFPYLINVCLLFKMRNNNLLNPFVDEWYKNININVFLLFVVTSGSLYDSFGIASSRIFGLEQFCAPLHFGDYAILLQYKFKYLLMIETIPQIIIQMVWIIFFNDADIYGNKITFLVIISIAVSVITLLSSILEYLFQKKDTMDYYINNNKVNTFKITLKLNDNDSITINEDIQKIKFKQYYYLSMKKTLCKYFYFHSKRSDIIKIKFDEQTNELFIYGVVLLLNNPATTTKNATSSLNLTDKADFIKAIEQLFGFKENNKLSLTNIEIEGADGPIRNKGRSGDDDIHEIEMSVSFQFQFHV